MYTHNTLAEPEERCWRTQKCMNKLA